MSRRRKKTLEKQVPCYGAASKTHALRRRALATYKTPFTLRELIEALFSRLLLDEMRRVFPLVTDSVQGVDFSGTVTFGHNEFRFCIEMYHEDYIAPREDLLKPNFHSPVWEHLTLLAQEENKWAEVLGVINYFNRVRATPGAVANYWPSMKALVETNHPIHNVTPGAPFHEPKELGSHIQQIRSSAVTITAGLLCPDNKPLDGSRAQISINSGPYIALL